jgi:hypothetical protein
MLRNRQTRYGVDGEHFRQRLLQDLLTSGLADQWESRAKTLLAACSRPGDFTGWATPDQIKARDRRLRADAERCLRHAALLRSGEDIGEDVRNVLSEVA